jgi:hypothetical protein
MKLKSLLALLLVTAAAFVCLTTSGTAQARPRPEEPATTQLDSLLETVELTTFIEQTQLKKAGKGDIKLMWWVPYQYWKVAGRNSTPMQKELLDEWSQKFKKYILIAVVDAKISKYTGVFSYKEKEAISDSIFIRLDDGKKLFPLSENKIDADIKDLLDMLPSLLGSSMGELGRNFHFFIFNNEDQQKNLLVDVDKKMKVEVTWDAANPFIMRLPLDLAVPPKFCPVDREQLSGKYEFCPYHGKPLTKK